LVFSGLPLHQFLNSPEHSFFFTHWPSCQPSTASGGFFPHVPVSLSISRLSFFFDVVFPRAPLIILFFVFDKVFFCLKRLCNVSFFFRPPIFRFSIPFRNLNSLSVFSSRLYFRGPSPPLLSFSLLPLISNLPFL